MDHLVGVLHRHTGPEHGEKLRVFYLRAQVEAGVEALHLLALAVPLAQLLLGGLLALMHAPLPEQLRVFPLELLELLVLLHLHARLLGGRGPVGVVIFDGGSQLGEVSVGDLVALHEKVDDPLLLCRLPLQLLGLAEPAVDDALGVLGVKVLVLPLHHLPVGLAPLFQRVGGGDHLRLLLLPGVGRTVFAVPGRLVRRCRGALLLAEHDVLICARFPPAGGTGERLGFALGGPIGPALSGGGRGGARPAVKERKVDGEQRIAVDHGISSFFVAGISPPCVDPFI